MQVSGLWQIHRTLQLSSSSNFRITSLLQKETLYLLAVTSSSPWTSFSHPWQTLVYLPVSVDLLIQSFYCQTIFHYMDMLIHQLMGIWILSTLWLLWMMLWTSGKFLSWKGAELCQKFLHLLGRSCGFGSLLSNMVYCCCCYSVTKSWPTLRPH